MHPCWLPDLWDLEKYKFEMSNLLNKQIVNLKWTELPSPRDAGRSGAAGAAGMGRMPGKDM